jgi:hypothetical protein
MYSTILKEIEPIIQRILYTDIASVLIDYTKIEQRNDISWKIFALMDNLDAIDWSKFIGDKNKYIDLMTLIASSIKSNIDGGWFCYKPPSPLPCADVSQAPFDVLTSIFTSIKGGVYIIKIKTEMPYYKIGCSRDPSKRLSAIRTHSPFDVDLIHIIPCDDMYEVERILHKRYYDKNVRGEWFVLTDEDVAEICAISGVSA